MNNLNVTRCRPPRRQRLRVFVWIIVYLGVRTHVSAFAQAQSTLKLEVLARKGTSTQLLEFSADSKYIASSADQYEMVWDTETGSMVGSQEAPDRTEQQALCGDRIAYLDANTLHLSTIQKGVSKGFPGFDGIDVRCNLSGTTAAIVTYAPLKLILVNLSDGKASAPIPLDEHPDGILFVSETQVAAWSTDHVFLYDSQNGLRSWPVKDKDSKPVSVGMWRNHLLVAEYEENYDQNTYVFSVRDVEKNETLIRQKNCHCYFASFNQKGGFVAAVEQHGTPGHIYVWDLTGPMVLSMDTKNSTDLVALNPDASLLAVEGSPPNSTADETDLLSVTSHTSILKLDAMRPLFVTTLEHIYGGGLLTAGVENIRVWDRDRGSVRAESDELLIGGNPSTAEKVPTLAIPVGNLASQGISITTRGVETPTIIPTSVEGRTALSEDGKYVAWSETHSMATTVRIADTSKGVPGDGGCLGHQGASSIGFASGNNTLYSWCVNTKAFAQTGTDTDQFCVYQPDAGLPATCKTMARFGIPLGFGNTSKSFYYAQPVKTGGSAAELRVVDTDTMNETLVFTLDSRPRKWVHRIGDPTQIAVLFDDRIELYGLVNGVLIKRASIPGTRKEALDILWTDEGVLFVAKGDSTVELISAARQQTLGYLVQLESAGDWVFVTPDGRFEGTAAAMRYVGWRDEAGRFFPLDYLFNTYYTPLIFASAMQDHPTSPSQRDLFSELQIPGLRTMVESEVAKIVQRGNQYVLCVNQEPDSLLYYSDGNAAAFDPGDFTDGNSDDCLHQYFIPDGHQIEVTTKQGMAQTAAPTTPWDKEKRTTPSTSRLKVLLIGVGTFLQDKSLDLLPAASESVDTLQNMFEGWAAKSNKGFAGVDLQVLKGPEATGAAIRAAFAALAQRAGPDDVVFIYMAGHGAIPAGQEMYFYLPTDAVSLSMSHLRQTALSSADFADFFMRLPAKRVLFFLDSCHSGGALESIVKAGGALASVEIANENAANASHTPYNAGVGIYLYASASPLNTIQMPEHGPTLLAQSLKEKLDDQASSDVWTSDLVRSIATRTQRSDSSEAPISLRIGFDFDLYPKP